MNLLIYITALIGVLAYISLGYIGFSVILLNSPSSLNFATLFLTVIPVMIITLLNLSSMYFWSPHVKPELRMLRYIHFYVSSIYLFLIYKGLLFLVIKFQIESPHIDKKYTFLLLGICSILIHLSPIIISAKHKSTE